MFGSRLNSQDSRLKALGMCFRFPNITSVEQLFEIPETTSIGKLFKLSKTQIPKPFGSCSSFPSLKTETTG